MPHFLRGMFAGRRAAPPPSPPPPEPAPEPDLPPRPTPWDEARALRAMRHEEAPPAPNVDELQRQDAADYEVRNAAGVEHITRVIAQRGVWFPGDD